MAAVASLHGRDWLLASSVDVISDQSSIVNTTDTQTEMQDVLVNVGQLATVLN